MRWALLLTTMMGGCATVTVFRLADERTCEQDVLRLDDGLLAHVVASTTDGSTFDYAPDRPLETRVEGRYDLASGEFSWNRTFIEGYVREVEVVEGVGTVYTDGDLDVDMTRTTRLSTKNRRVEGVREVRLGCEVERTVRNRSDVVVSVERGTYDDEGYAYTIDRDQDGHVVTAEGRIAWDRTSVETEAWRIGDVQVEQETTDDGAGRQVVAFRRVEAGVVREGEIRRAPDGSERWVFDLEELNATFSFDYEQDYSGDGEGTVEIRPRGRDATTCDVRLDGFRCTYQCPGLPAEGCP